MFEIQFTRLELLNFEDEVECVIYKDNNGQYWYEFQEPNTIRKVGRFDSLSEAKHAAGTYYQKEWVPF